MACLLKSNKKWFCGSRWSFSMRWRLDRSAVMHARCRSKRELFLAIVTRIDFDCVQEMSSKSSAIDTKKTGFVASPGTKNDQLLSRIAADSPAVTQSAVTLLSVMILLRSIYDELRYEKIFLLVCSAQRSRWHMLRKAETSAELKFWVPVAFKAGPPLIWVFGQFWLFASWYRRGREASSVKIL